jgi:hypothetical protein
MPKKSKKAQAKQAKQPEQNPVRATCGLLIGCYLVSPVGEDRTHVLIRHKGGEAGVFDAAKLETVIAKFYNDNF